MTTTTGRPRVRISTSGELRANERLTFLHIVINTHYVPKDRTDEMEKVTATKRLVDRMFAEGEDSPIVDMLFRREDYPPRGPSGPGVGITDIQVVAKNVETSPGTARLPSGRFALGPRPQVHAHIQLRVVHNIPIVRGRTYYGAPIHGLDARPIAPRIRAWWNARWGYTRGVHVWVDVGEESRTTNYVQKARGTIGARRNFAMEKAMRGMRL